MGGFKKFFKKLGKSVKKVGKAIAAPTTALAKAVKNVPVVGTSLSSALNAQGSIVKGQISKAVKQASSAAVTGAPIAAGVGLASGGMQYANTLAKGAIPEGLSNAISSVQNVTGSVVDTINRAGSYAGGIANKVQALIDTTRPFLPSNDPEPAPEPEPDFPEPAPVSSSRGSSGGGGGGGFDELEPESEGMSTTTKILIGVAIVGAVYLVSRNRK